MAGAMPEAVEPPVSAEEGFHFEPAISIDRVPEDTTREAAVAMCRQVRASDAQKIEALVSTRVASEMDKVPIHLRAVVSDIVRASYLDREYFNIVREVLQHDNSVAPSLPLLSPATTGNVLSSTGAPARLQVAFCIFAPHLQQNRTLTIGH